MATKITHDKGSVSSPGGSAPNQAEPQATVRQDIGRPGAKPPERPDNIAENPVGKANPPVDQR